MINTLRFGITIFLVGWFYMMAWTITMYFKMRIRDELSVRTFLCHLWKNQVQLLSTHESIDHDITSINTTKLEAWDRKSDYRILHASPLLVQLSVIDRTSKSTYRNYPSQHQSQLSIMPHRLKLIDTYADWPELVDTIITYKFGRHLLNNDKNSNYSEQIGQIDITTKVHSP